MRRLFRSFLPAFLLAVFLVLLFPPHPAQTDPADHPLEIEALAADLAFFGPASSNLGSSFAARHCDFNGDGVQDLLVGASGYSDGTGVGYPDRQSSVFLLYGQAGVPAGTIRDLAVAEPDVVIWGIRESYLYTGGFGYTLGCGDVNGDGRPDILISAPWSSNPNLSRTNSGEVYVVYNRPDPPSIIDLNITPPDVTFRGTKRVEGITVQFADYLGSSLAVGDLNRDFIDDIIMGAPGNAGPDESRRIPGVSSSAGAVYVVYGNPTLPLLTDFNDDSPDLMFYGEEAYDGAGRAVAVDDLNGDGFADLVVGAGGGDGPENSRDGGIYTASVGEVYILYGSATLPVVVDVLGEVGPEPDVRIYGGMGEYTDEWGTVTMRDALGSPLAVADVSGDGVADLLIGAPYWGGILVGRPGAGALYIIYGGDLPPVRDMMAEVGPGPDAVLWGDEGCRCWGADNLASSIAAADVNGDGVADIIAVAEDGNGPSYRWFTGATYVVYGGNLPPVMDIRRELGPGADVTLYSGPGLANTSVGAGNRATGADLDGDGTAEFIVGSGAWLPPPTDGPEGRNWAGQVLVFSLPRLAALPPPPVPSARHYNERRKRLKINVPGATGEEVVDINGHPVGPWWDIRQPIEFLPDTEQFVVKGGPRHLQLSVSGRDTIVIIKNGIRGSPYRSW